MTEFNNLTINPTARAERIARANGWIDRSWLNEDGDAQFEVLDPIMLVEQDVTFDDEAAAKGRWEYCCTFHPTVGDALTWLDEDRQDYPESASDWKPVAIVDLRTLTRRGVNQERRIEHTLDDRVTDALA